MLFFVRFTHVVSLREVVCALRRLCAFGGLYLALQEVTSLREITAAQQPLPTRSVFYFARCATSPRPTDDSSATLSLQTPCQTTKVKKVLRVLRVLRVQSDKRLPFWQKTDSIHVFEGNVLNTHQGHRLHRAAGLVHLHRLRLLCRHSWCYQ